MQQYREDGQSFATWRIAVHSIPYLHKCITPSPAINLILISSSDDSREQWRIQNFAKGGGCFRQGHQNAESRKRYVHFAASSQALNKFLIYNSSLNSTYE